MTRLGSGVAACLVALLGGCTGVGGLLGDAGVGGGVAAGGGTGAGGGTAAGGGSATGGGAAAGGGSATGGGAAAGGGVAAGGPAVPRGGTYLGFPERFNRYYTDPTWRPSRTVYVSATGTGDGSSAATPAAVAAALAAVTPGTLVHFLRGAYAGCYQLDSSRSGTADDPVVLYGERNPDGTLGVTISCCATGRATCLNLEAADQVAVDGFELAGGDYGVRAVGAAYAADQHQRGVAVLNNHGHGQNKDPFFTGQSDWLVLERNLAHDSGSGDGHGIYLSNGSDWNLVRFNETYNTFSADFQINADPASACVGFAFNDPECDAVAGGSSATAGRGASDFMWVEGNFFHHSLAQGANFTSARNSLIRNNLFALPARHGVSFWQETSNPLLGARDNTVVHNLFVTSVAGRQAVQFVASSTGNQFKNNLIVAVTISGGSVTASAAGQLLSTDATTLAANTFEHNAWLSGFFGSEDSSGPYVPGASELRRTDFSASWFAAFPTVLGHEPAAFRPSATAPWLTQGNLLAAAPTDRDGQARVAPVDLGPYNR